MFGSTRITWENMTIHVLHEPSLFTVFDTLLDKNVAIDRLQITSENKELVVTIALNYGGRHDIINATNEFLKFNKSKLDSIEMKESDFKKFVFNKDIPDPDLLIRTGGEIRLSNFLLWDLAYTELIFLPEMWPDFCKTLLEKCILEYSKRNRKYGE